MNFTSKLFPHIATAFFFLLFLQPDVWNTCLFRPVFATWLSQTRSHLHINSHRRTPDAKNRNIWQNVYSRSFAVPRAICFGALLQITQTITRFVHVKPKFSFFFHDLSKNACVHPETVAGNSQNKIWKQPVHLNKKTLMLGCNQWEDKARVNVRDERVSEG